MIHTNESHFAEKLVVDGPSGVGIGGFFGGVCGFTRFCRLYLFSVMKLLSLCTRRI